MSRRTNVIVNLQIEGVHNWPDCNIAEVDFLKHPHRHIFHICCKKRVSHDDRDIEIIKLKRQIEHFLKIQYGKVSSHLSESCNFGSMSCESIANELQWRFDLVYCSVLEDGENGAEIIVEDE